MASDSDDLIWLSLILAIVFFGLLLAIVKSRENKFVNDRRNSNEINFPPSPFKLPTPPPLKSREVIGNSCESTQSELVFFIEEGKRFGLDDLLEATADLKSQTLCSSLYKVNLEKNGSVFAVKRLKKLQVSIEEFDRTMKEIGNLKHPNLLPLVGFNNSTMEEKLLIYWYQSNGSLLNLLEDNADEKREFPWKYRVSIAHGIARGLNFIHQNDSITNALGNLKPSNILLNENYEPLISEVGYIKFMNKKSICFLPTSGYMAPEKALSKQGDVYSFGVILLELLTGKVVEKTGLDLPKWVKSMVKEEWTAEVFDKRLGKVGIYAYPLLNIALKCVAHFAENRPGIREVIAKIEEIDNKPEDPPPYFSPINLYFEDAEQDKIG
ncbi:leucine-rich repeat receptor-like protein kinase PXC1 [Impatiens glandulifera]|uniref:leucine-rich repeat receptor-like protein kinase PXC1 n=1 Tax=Impatiens glandulifera TaxID=253017 RepID=UPI001FB0893E|nr:leucine-rich repeat receptor-like protein kinase PXC1 [Impatiens glandulifera]